MPSANCFDAPTLKNYLLGKLTDDQSDVVAVHLEACLNCEATVAELDRASDTLTSGLRLPAMAAEPATDDALQQALDRVQSLEPSAEHHESSKTAVDRSPLLRDYRLLEALGFGGMGTVYKAVHTRLDRLVAVKLLPARRLGDEQAVARFQREMRVIGQLSHPAIVQATDAGEVDGTHFLVMEYVEGHDLNTIAKACGPLSIADACEIARQAALGLEYAHQQGIVHRDIKPSNLMLSSGEGRGARGEENRQTSHSPLAPPPSPLLKILDLGLALLSGEQAPVDELTTVGQLMGTLDYMAPEQLEDSHLVGPRADIYALAATLYRLLTGVAPFAKDDRKTPLQKLRALATQAAPPIRERRADVPEELAAIIDRALSRDPAARFVSMSEFAAALAPWCMGHDLGELSQRACHLAQPVSDTGCSLPGSLSPWERAGVREPSVTRHRSRNSSANDRRSGEDHRTSDRVPHSNPLPKGEGTGRRRSGFVLAILAFFGFVAFGIVITIETNKGTLIVESLRDGVEVRVKKSGKSVEQLELTTGPKTARLTAGEYEIEIIGDADGLQIQNGNFVLKRGDTVVAKITEKPKAIVAATPAGAGMGSMMADKDSAPPAEAPPRKPVEIVDRTAKGMETFEASNPDLAAEKQIRDLLQKSISVGFGDIPLNDVLKFLEEQTQVVFFLENEALQEDGKSADTPITLTMTDKPATTVLKFLLRPMQLAWHIDGGQVVVTTMQKEKNVFVTRTYPIGKLLPGVSLAVARLKSEPLQIPGGQQQGGLGGGGGGGFFHVSSTSHLVGTLPALFGQFGGGGVPQPPAIPTEASHFVDLLSESLGYQWADRNGEGGTCELLHNVLVVRHTRRAHADIESLLRTVEAALLKPLTEPVEIRPAGYSLEADENVRRHLARKMDVAFDSTTLSDVAEFLSDKLEVQVLIDREALTEENIPTDVPVTLQFQGIAGDVLMSRWLKPLQLAHDIENGLLVITTMAKLQDRHVTKVYDVRELFDRGLHPTRLIAGLAKTTPGPWSTTDGEGGTLTLFADTLLAVRQTSRSHDEVAKFLASLRSQLVDQPVVPRTVLPKSEPAIDIGKLIAPQPLQPQPGLPTTSTKPPAKPTADSQPRYDGKTFDEWLAVLDVERSPARLADAFQALRLLYQDDQAEKVAQRVLTVFRLADPGASYGETANRRQIVTDARELLDALPTKIVQAAAAIELGNGNSRSRRFLFNYVLARNSAGAPIVSPQLPKAVLAISRDSDVSVRAAALGWLTLLPRNGIGSESIPEATTRIRESLSDKAPEVAFWAVKGLLDSEPDTAAVVEALKRLIGTSAETAGLNDVSLLQGEALILVAVMGPRAAAAAPAIAPFLLLRDPPNGQGQRGFTIGSRGGGPGSTQLSIKGLAALALARMGKAAASALPTIEEALKQHGDSPRPTLEPSTRSFGGGQNPFGGASGFGRGAGRSSLALVSFLELLIAAKTRLEDRPAADPTDKAIEVKPEDILLVQSLLRLLQTEQVLLEHHYGLGSERPELRELDQKLKAAEAEFDALWKLYNEQRKNLPRKPGGM